MVYNTVLDLHCVIIGWDKELKAPSEWSDIVSDISMKKIYL